MKIIKNHAIQEGMLLILLCGYLFYYSLSGYAAAFNKEWSQSPFLFPLVLAAVIGVLALVILIPGIRSVCREPVREAEAAKKPDHGAAGRILIIIGLCAAYYAMLRWVNLPYLALPVGPVTLQFSTFELATILFLLVMMAALGVRKKAVLICVPAGTALFLSVMFRSLLHVILP